MPNFEINTTLAPALPDQVPTIIANYLAERSAQYTNQPQLAIHEFDELLFSPQPNGVTSFMASHDKTWATTGETEKIFHIADASPVGELVGYGELRYAHQSTLPYFLNKPFIGWIHTEPAYRFSRQNNLMARLTLMKTLADVKYGLPLYSDTLISTPATRVARSLVRAGLATEIAEGESTRYRSV